MSRRKVTVMREANGRPQRVPQLPAPSEIRRLRDAALSGLRDPIWGTELGRLYLVGKINSVMYAAGKRWGEMAVQYSQALCSPAPDPRAICLERMGGSVVDPDSPDGRREAKRHQRAVESFMDARAALKTASLGSERLVRSLCERDEMVHGHENLIVLSVGLLALAGFWGLTGTGKSASDRHTS